MNNRWLTQTSFPVSHLRREVDRVFDDVMGDFLSGGAWPLARFGYRERSFPAVNVWEEGDKMYVEAELPGLKLEDIEILAKGDELTLKGERKSDDQEGLTYHRRERSTGAFCNVVHLPIEVDIDKTDARLENGVLTVVMPKAASARPRKIEVKALKS